MSKNIGYGSTLSIASNTIGYITGITPPEYSRDSIDTTDMDSADGFRQFLPGLVDAGEVSFEFDFDASVSDSSNINKIRENIEAGPNVEAVACIITFPDGETVSFNGFVTGFRTDAPLEDKMTGSATIKVSGKPTWAAAPEA